MADLRALEHGVYIDECQNLMEEEIYNYYAIPFTETTPENDPEDDISDEDEHSETSLEDNRTEGDSEPEQEFEDYLGFDVVEV